MSEKLPYHHGNLRNALLDGGLALLEENGPAGLSLRAIAARAGVSHAAPAHHFGNLKGLLTALVTLAFQRFTQAMADERATAAPAAVEQMRAAARGYIGFARDNPALFRLMFASTDVDFDNPALHAASGLAYAQLQEISRPAADAQGIFTDVGREEIANLVWTTTHGYAHLLAEGRMEGRATRGIAPPPDIAGLLFGSWVNPVIGD